MAVRIASALPNKRVGVATILKIRPLWHGEQDHLLALAVIYPLPNEGSRIVWEGVSIIQLVPPATER